MLKNLSHLLSSFQRILVYIILIGLSFALWYSTTDIGIMFGNYGKLHTYTDISLSVIMIVGFPLFLIAVLYKSLKYWKRADINWKTGTGMIWGIIGTIISGASCCWATLAASFGLLPLMSFLPYSWLEIKIIGTIWLLYALWDILSNLETCKIHK